MQDSTLLTPFVLSLPHFPLLPFFPAQYAIFPSSLSLPVSPSLTSSLRPSLRPSPLLLQEMSHLIRTQRAMTSTPSLTATPSPTTTPTIATTAPAEMDHRPANPVDPVGPPVPQAQASSTSSVVLPVSARFTHRYPRTTNQTSPLGSIIDASGTRPSGAVEEI
ncbi:uncharacterized protein LOC126598541 [Malus sylvestris]|uniref:uncharacterized protein LOC126598541 n=1 Tax=Malus sylvestris TaxID=3752 RepID=UPI0021AC9C3C|nr:uncharacterized protein LOC126598541 [Malus sylvestris]